jgi:hypothetical protein
MKANTNAAMAASDFPALADALDTIATMAPASGYPNWVSISRDGARAARAASMTGVKASCRGCHDQYKQKYRSELRSRPVP